jgi:oligopeptide transport system permease protein
MLFFLLKRISFAFPIFFAVTFLTFVLIHAIPGGPFDGEKEMSVDIREKLNERYGLDRPLGEQYWRDIKNVFKSDFGPSYKYSNWDVIELVKSKAWVSFELGTYGMLFALVIGILMGIVCIHFHMT